MNIKKLLLSAAAVLLSLTALCSCGENAELRLGTGNPGGIYYAYGTMLRELDDCGIAVKKTEGSRANKRLMNEGFLDLAIVQSDVLYEAASGTGAFEGAPVNSVRAVAGLYYEAFQIVTRGDSGIVSLADLKGRKISVGEEGSGVAKNAEYLLLSAGIPYSSVETVNMSYAESAAALESGEIDAFFAILGAPATVITELAQNCEIAFIPLDERTVASMTGLYSGYYAMTIPAGTYSGQTADIPTVGVKAVLTADSRVSSESIRAVTAVLFEKAAELKYTMTVPAPDIEFAVTDIPCRFHQGAADYYSWNGVTVSTESASSPAGLLLAASGD